jgi:hypothetical protein
MSRPPEYEYGSNGANGVNEAHGVTGSYGAHGEHPDGGAPQGTPNVYHPQPESAPSYEEYADPAVAHGWQSAYDETCELPPVPDGPGEVRRSGAGRRARRKPSPWRSRRTAVAAGAVGAVSAVAVAVGLSFSGAPSDGVRGKEERTSPTAGDSSGSTAPASPGGAAADRSSAGPTEPSGAASRSPGVSSSAAGGETRQPSTPAGTTAAPAPTATTGAVGRGNSGNKPGRGQGGTKGPK